MIANRFQIEAAIHMVISTVPNTARDAPYDSALTIRLCSMHVGHGSFVYIV